MPLSCNLGTLTSWNPLSHSRPVTGLLYLTQKESARCYNKWTQVFMFHSNVTCTFLAYFLKILRCQISYKSFQLEQKFSMRTDGQTDGRTDGRKDITNLMVFFFGGATARVGLGLLYNTPPSLSIPSSVSPFIHYHLSQVREHVIQPWALASLTMRLQASRSLALSLHSFITIFLRSMNMSSSHGPWPPLQYASKPLDPLLYLSIRLFPSFSGP